MAATRNGKRADVITTDVRFLLQPKQRAFVASDAPFSFYLGGVGAGKTHAGSVRAMLHALQSPGSLGFIGAPTYTMLRDTTQRTFFALLPRETISRYNRNNQHLILVNGAEILFRSLDEPDRARGLNLGWFWLDEAPLCGYYAWQVLKGRLRQQGQTPVAWATGTPKGRDGFYQDFERTLQPGHQLFRASTFENATNLPPDYVASLGYTGAFYDQEVLGLFTAFEGLVYRLETDPQATDTHLKASPVGKTFARVIGGIDWGYTNPTVLVIFGLDGDGRAWQLAEFYQRHVSLHETVLPTLIEMTREHNVEQWYAGPDEPEHIDEANKVLGAAHLAARVRGADNRINAGIQTVSRLLTLRGDGTRGLYIAPSCVQTIAEYNSYQFASSEGHERNAEEKPLKQNDHCFVAGTLVLTARGEVPIESVTMYDHVWTRQGWWPVLAAGMTDSAAHVYRMETDDGRVLTGTTGHPVWVNDTGWTSLSLLMPRDLLCTWTRKQSALAAYSPDDTPSWPTSTPNGVFVVSHVRHVRSMPQRAAVYNLTVAGTPEYFANGMLVHNCMDASRYALHTALARSRNLASELEQRVALRGQALAAHGLNGTRTLRPPVSDNHDAPTTPPPTTGFDWPY